MLLSSGLALLGVRPGSAIDNADPVMSTKEIPFRISLNTSTISGYNLSVEQQIEYCAKAGFGGIELWTRDICAFLKKGGSYQQLVRKLQSGHLILENKSNLSKLYNLTK